MEITAAIGIVEGVETLIAQEPAIAAALQGLFAKGIPTPAEFAALKALILSESYKTLVPNTDLPPSALS